MKTNTKKTKKTNSKTSSVGITQYQKKSEIRHQYLNGTLDRNEYRQAVKKTKKEDKGD